MYSRIDIIKAVKKKDISIKPFSRGNLQPNSYKLHLDSEIAIAKKGRINLLTTEDFEKFYDKKEIRKIVLTPKRFILAKSMERLFLSKNIGAFVNGRSSLSRVGISVTQTAPIIQAGHGVPRPRKIILEISNGGPFEVVLTPKMAIAEICFFELKTPTNILYDSFGRYGTRRDRNELLPLKE